MNHLASPRNSAVNAETPLPNSDVVLFENALLVSTPDSTDQAYYSIDSDIEVEINQGLPSLEDESGSVVSPFEFWPTWVFYTPVILQSIILALRYRSLTLPLIANPGIELSGFVGESKQAVLELAGPEARQWIAPFIVLDRNQQALTEQCDNAKQELVKAGFHFPVVAKPDIGCRGAGVRLIENEQQLSDYILHFPTRQRYLLQQKAPYSAEAGIFYVRHPQAEGGQIFSLALKYTPFVIGDGVRSLRQLIESDERAGRVPHLYLPRHQHRLHEIIPTGKKFPLSFSGSHCRGSIFRDGNHLITDALVQRLDTILEDMPGFHYGRLDIKFKDVDSLKAGEDLCILEVNGASSEAAHIWDKRTPLREILGTLLKQYRLLYVLGDHYRKKGHALPKISHLLRAWRKERQLVANYPTTD